jgi:hypothetical protein
MYMYINQGLSWLISYQILVFQLAIFLSKRTLSKVKLLRLALLSSLIFRLFIVVRLYFISLAVAPSSKRLSSIEFYLFPKRFYRLATKGEATNSLF